MLGTLLQEFAQIAVYLCVVALDCLFDHVGVEVHVFADDLQLTFDDFLTDLLLTLVLL